MKNSQELKKIKDNLENLINQLDKIESDTNFSNEQKKLLQKVYAQINEIENISEGGTDAIIDVIVSINRILKIVVDLISDIY